MGGDDFFRTRMGHRFFEATMPKIADELERLNTNLEALVAELRMRRTVRDEGCTHASVEPASASNSKWRSNSPVAPGCALSPRPRAACARTTRSG